MARTRVLVPFLLLLIYMKTVALIKSYKFKFKISDDQWKILNRRYYYTINLTLYKPFFNYLNTVLIHYLIIL